ncbi:hypothetical protein BDW59DRAFT_151782 [Aspergillus cavernicola]|uniref:Uncharacterized protein n=1 Tax=Aspergillus cavernicola TaxID=176166 RepID=A0ABR4HVA4_9EURO
MGIVHWLRKVKKRQNTSVFRLSTDSYCFMFCYIDESSHVCLCCLFPHLSFQITTSDIKNSTPSEQCISV